MIPINYYDVFHNGANVIKCSSSNLDLMLSNDVIKYLK